MNAPVRELPRNPDLFFVSRPIWQAWFAYLNAGERAWHTGEAEDWAACERARARMAELIERAYRL